MHTKRTLAIIILAAGRGTRMRPSRLPKALISFGGRPMITWILDAVQASELDVEPTIVVGSNGEMIIDELGPYYNFVYQREQLGTGHAVREALRQLPPCDDVLVLNGDHPLIAGATVRQLAFFHQHSDNPITLATVTVSDYLGWRSTFTDFGRIIRDEREEVVAIVEARHASHEQRALTEVNPAYYCFSHKWLENTLPLLAPNPSNGEYYLTDLIAMARYEELSIGAIQVKNPREGLGINSPEQLREIERVFEISNHESNF